MTRRRAVLVAAGLLAAVGLLAVGLVLRPGGDRFAFAPQVEPQRATFLTEPWVGGGGYPVLVGWDARRTLGFDGRRVLVLAGAAAVIRAGLGPQPVGGRPTMLVEAWVHLEPATATITSNPPMQDSVYEVVIDRLVRAEYRDRRQHPSPGP